MTPMMQLPVDPRRIPNGVAPLDRVAMRLIIRKDGCWGMTGTTSSTGYHSIDVAGRSCNVHRWLYQSVVGPIPDGMQLDHLCRNRGCVNPDHLEPVSQRENLRRGDGLTGRNARKTHCMRGHEFTPENTMVRKTGQRNCRTCANANRAARRARALRPAR